MREREIVEQILWTLLADGPQPGARLKQRLVREYERSYGRRFDERDWGFEKFVHFLQDVQGIEVVRPDGLGDVTVRLTPNVGPSEQAGFQFFRPLRARLPEGVWIALVNPDPERLRFLHRDTKEVLHHQVPPRTQGDLERAARVIHDRRFVEIAAIPARVFSEWMTTFVRSFADLEPREADVLLALAAASYSSALDRTFTNALGVRGAAWRHYRREKVMAWAESWCEQNDISFDDLRGLNRSLGEEVTLPNEPVSLGMREYIIAAVNRATDAELERIQLPVGLILRMTLQPSLPRGEV
jgi:hypothetical protein